MRKKKSTTSKFAHWPAGTSPGRQPGLTAFILIGALIQAIAMRLFLIPSNLVSGGISGIIPIG